MEQKSVSFWHKMTFWLLAALLVTGLLLVSQPNASALEPNAPTASGWILVKFPQGQPLCTGVGYQGGLYFDGLDCGFGYVSVSETTSTSTVTVQIIDASDTVRDTQTATYREEDVAWEFDITPDATWSPGKALIRVTVVDGQNGNFGEISIFYNQLGAAVAPTGFGYAPGDDIEVTGTIYEIDQIPPLAGTQTTAVPATFSLQTVAADGSVSGPFGPYTADTNGEFTATIPGTATQNVTAGADAGYQTAVSIQVVNATYTDPLTGQWGAEQAGSGSITLSVPPDTLLVENSFVSSVGWVKPGDTYPFRIFVRNFTDSAASNVAVTIPPVDSTTFTQVSPLNGAGSALINSDGSITWSVGNVPAASNGNPALVTLVVEGTADTLGQDPQIVWKDLSSTATLTYDGGPTGLTSMSHGPKVIPPSGGYETARYGDRPFPVVPVDYFDRKHDAAHTGETLANKINSPDVPGSTFNLFQENSLGQLFPNGTVPSAAIASAGWNYGPGFQFSELSPQGTCTGVTYKDAQNTAVYPERIVNGWYQLPGDTGYYGSDRFGSAVAGAVAGVGPLLDIDSACGPTGKAVFDAAQIADPEIDYNEFDTDKDGVVDFFMMVFVGLGGNGASQLSVPPYDNIWPHSSSLEFYFTDPGTGLKGYISDDQLKSLTEVPQCWTSNDYSSYDDCAANGGTGINSLPVFVRVGPYNVNPESAIDNASVISHEYGHSLGLPDFYSLGNRETYGDWNLMATDKSHHMDIFAKQDMGWIVPIPLNPGETRAVTNWQGSKTDIGTIQWQQPNGTPYTLSAANGHQNIHNAEAYVAKLPSRQLIDPAKVAAGASPDHVWWSGSGNDFGCPPAGGHNFDIFLPELANLPAGTQVTVEFNSYFDIEWDYDYGFVLVSTDGGNTYQSAASQNGYTTDAAQNPNANSCQQQYGNGLTGTSGSYTAGTSASDRLLGIYPDGGFVPDSYDISFAAGSSTVLRFSYATDPGLARPGWFIDDLKVTAGSTVIYDTDFEEENDERIFNGGCQGDLAVAASCTVGWTYVSAADGSPADHAYYMEMRDRSGFDFDGRGENDRDPIGFEPGLLLVITDEARGYGNVGADNPPVQSPVDSRPEPGSDTPNLNDAAFKLNDSYSDFGPNGWVDNYSDPNDPQGADAWRHLFDCLSFTVDSLAGTDIGPEELPGNLTGNVTFTMGDGCATFNYGQVDPGDNNAPTAVAQANPTNPDVNETVTFDGSASFDDLTPGSQLSYEWDFDGDGTYDTTGQVTSYAYSAAGTYNAQLRVTDEGGLTDVDTITITVGGNAPPTSNNDTATVTPGGEVDIDVLANDSDPDGDPLTITNYSDGNYGTVTQNSDGTLKYTHDGSATASDSFTYTISDGNGRSDSAIVTITITNDPPPPPNAGAKTTGGGWLATVEGKKLNYSFNAKEMSGGYNGHLQLNDKNADVKIDIDVITAITSVNGNCGSVPTAANSLEIQGSGTHNDANATFRFCVQDNSEPGKNSDLFYLECIAGCNYNSGSRTDDDIIDAGNIQVNQGTSGSASANSSSSGSSSMNGSASTLQLNPVLLTEGIAGQVQPFTVVAYDQNQDVLANADIVLTRVAADGTIETFTALTDGAGTAVFNIVNLVQTSEYIATSGAVESNAIEVSPIITLP